MKNIQLLILFLVFLGACNPKNKERTDSKKLVFTEDWESLKQHSTPNWFMDAKFGIYTHWGPLTIGTTVSGNTFYGSAMYKKEDKCFNLHKEIFGDQNEVGYKDVIRMFNPKKFDPAEWAELFYKSGARFAGPVAIHHDNFAMWKSDVTRWNVYKIAGIDVTGELEREIRKRGMKFMTSFHHGAAWKYFEPSYKFDGADPQYSDLYCDVHSEGENPNERFEREWLAKITEVIDNYQPDLIWFDFGIFFISEEYNKKFYSYYFNRAAEWGKDVVVTIKKDAKKRTPGEFAVLDIEDGRENRLVKYPWLTDTSVGPWFYTQSFEEIDLDVSKYVRLLVDIVSKNGCLLLNIPPRADGSISENVKKGLIEMGDWLRVNGEAIYYTRPWKIYGEGPTKIDDKNIRKPYSQNYTSEDIRYTSKDNIVYAFPMLRPDSVLKLKSFGKSSTVLDRKIKSVQLLGADGKIKWEQTDEALVIPTVNLTPLNDLAWVFKIKLK